jgi:hyperosmotically inducible protein
MFTSSRTARVVRHTLVSLGVAAALGLSLGASAQDATAHSNGVGAAVSDTGITAKVKSSFVGDDRLKGSHIKVVTTNGVVTLSGTAPTSDSKGAAEDLAKAVSGVRSVDDQVSTPESSSSMHKVERVGSDSWITTKVKSELLADSASKGFHVHVKTLHGVVMLHGTLPSSDAVAHVKDVAGKVEHVKSVDTSELKVAAT